MVAMLRPDLLDTFGEKRRAGGASRRNTRSDFFHGARLPPQSCLGERRLDRLVDAHFNAKAGAGVENALCARLELEFEILNGWRHRTAPAMGLDMLANSPERCHDRARDSRRQYEPPRL